MSRYSKPSKPRTKRQNTSRKSRSTPNVMMTTKELSDAGITRIVMPNAGTERRGAAAADVEMQTGAESAAPRSLQ